MSHVVIGAGYGDEGKGLMTDYLVRKLNAKTVARFNGGAQASHTVVDGERRHAFSHMSAGTFAGAGTWLSSDFIVNPLALIKEVQALRAMGVEPPPLYVSENARTTLIYDMVINGLLENSRGSARHGSCGLGINETVTRYDAGHGHRLKHLRIASERVLMDHLRYTLTEWVPSRLKELKVTLGDGPLDKLITEPDVLRDADALYSGMRYMNVMPDVRASGLLPSEIVLEGAQGLMLDEELGEFPHVTRSRTGLVQALDAYFQVTPYIEPLQPVYVTRCYTTRHGAGPLLHAGEHFTDNDDIFDATNVPNPWQGHLRYAPLDLGELRRFINADLKRGREAATFTHNMHSGFIEKPVLALTCVDQLVRDVLLYDRHGRSRTIYIEDLVPFIEEEVGFKVKYISHGPSAATMEER